MPDYNRKVPDTFFGQSLRVPLARGVEIANFDRLFAIDPHGAASCRFATRSVLRTRPGHPIVIPSFLGEQLDHPGKRMHPSITGHTVSTRPMLTVWRQSSRTNIIYK